MNRWKAIALILIYGFGFALLFVMALHGRF
jgi:hypothetical protein